MRVSAELAGEDLLDHLRATPATEYLVVEETGEIYGVLSTADVERAFVEAMARPRRPDHCVRRVGHGSPDARGRRPGHRIRAPRAAGAPRGR